MPRTTTPGNPPALGMRGVRLEQFRGVDFSSNAVNVDESRSPDAPNMMPDADGYPTKRPGWKAVSAYPGRINGSFVLNTPTVTKRMIHAGTGLYYEQEKLYEGVRDEKSWAVQLEGKLWFLDGEKYLYYDGEKVEEVANIATVPVISISRAPGGQTDATSMYPINLLTGKRTEQFLGTADAVDYFFSFTDLSDTKVEALLLNAEGEWVAMDEDDGFAVDRMLGKVTFETAPGKSPVTGEDNVKITYETKTSKADTIGKCRFGILYGVRGALDRIFVSGNPEEPNVDHWSEFNDPAYFPDLAYAILGQEGSPIMGYSVLGERLVAHKTGEENGRNVFLRVGQLTEEEVEFPIVGVITGEGALSAHAFVSMQSEPLFLTRRGIYALTPSDVTGERYAQNRSYYVNARLCKEANLQEAYACVWNRFYVLCINGSAYLLDGQQKAYERNEPHSAHQYECYHFTNLPVRIVWADGDALWFGTEDGRICTFGEGGRKGLHSDNGVAVKAWWTTPLLELGTWGNYKRISGVWATFQPFNKSSGRIYYGTDREAGRLAREFEANILDWNDVDFDDFSFESSDRPKIVASRAKTRKTKLFQLRLENAKDEPFGIFAIQIAYKTGGKIRK